MNAIGTLLARAADDHLPSLLAGGHAVITHGHARTTFDIDLVIRRSDREKWTVLVSGLGYAAHKEGPNFSQFNPPGPDMLPLDLILVSDDTFAKLDADAVSAPAGAGGARCVSLRHLIALKCHAIKHGHPGRIVKDADDVIRLVQANRLNVEHADIRDLFLKFGTTDLYEKVRRICTNT